MIALRHLLVVSHLQIHRPERPCTNHLGVKIIGQDPRKPQPMKRPLTSNLCDYLKAGIRSKKHDSSHLQLSAPLRDTHTHIDHKSLTECSGV